MVTNEELDEFVTKKRLMKGQKLEWAKKIIDASLGLIDKKGTFFEIGNRNIKYKPKGVIHKSMNIQYLTPFLKLPGLEDQYLLDIWYKKKGKVFSARWEPFSITTFKRTEWLYDLFG